MKLERIYSHILTEPERACDPTSDFATAAAPDDFVPPSEESDEESGEDDEAVIDRGDRRR